MQMGHRREGLFYFGITKGNFLKKMIPEQNLEGRGEGFGRQRRKQSISDEGYHRGKSTEVASLGNSTHEGKGGT